MQKQTQPQPGRLSVIRLFFLRKLLLAVNGLWLILQE
jgi:hypothetical protein